MSRRAAKYVIVAALVLLSIEATAQSSLNADRSQSNCHEQETLLSVWQSQGVINSIDYRDGYALVKVYQRNWLHLPVRAQASIGLAAFCRVASHASLGRVDVGSEAGRIFGTVIDGRWHNLLFGD